MFEFWQVIYILIALAGLGVGWLLNVWLGLGVIFACLIVFKLICVKRGHAKKRRGKKAHIMSM